MSIAVRLQVTHRVLARLYERLERAYDIGQLRQVCIARTNENRNFSISRGNRLHLFKNVQIDSLIVGYFVGIVTENEYVPEDI